MATLILLRHGRTAANATGVLAGWTEGIGLDDTGREQARRAAERLAVVPLAAIVASPLQRCQETAAAVAAVPGPRRRARPGPVTDDRLGEVRYGDWTGRPLKDLAREPLWRTVQSHPSAVRFPGEGGEAMTAMQARAVEAVREHDARVTADHGPDAIWLAVSHGDVIKALLADALGLHLDGFQRIVVETASVSVVRYAPLRPFVVRMNDQGSDLAALVPPGRPRRRSRAASSDAVPGGETGTAGTS